MIHFLKNLDKVPGNSNPVIVCISHSTLSKNVRGVGKPGN